MEEQITNKILADNLEKHIWETEIAIAYITHKRNESDKLIGVFSEFRYQELIDRLNSPLSIMKNSMNINLADDENYGKVLSYICIAMIERGSPEFKCDEFNNYRNIYIRDNKIESLLDDTRD